VASVHDPKNLPDIEGRKGDFDDPEGLTKSFTGAERLLLISASGIDFEKRVARHRNAIQSVNVTNSAV